MKKRLVISLLCLSVSINIGAQEEYEFTTVRELKITPVKNQSRSGTCWSFSGVGLIEAELLRTGKGEYDLSEMFVVNHSYRDKADKYVRMHGYLNFAQGGSFADVLYVFKHYGAVPRAVYNGLAYGGDIHVHGEMEQMALGSLKAVTANPNGKLSPVWREAFREIIDSYLGKIPETFTIDGKSYTPKNFGESLGLNMDDYISLTSFSHEPFYAPFALEIPDNWRWALSYNVPLEELTETVAHAIHTGFTVAWATDVSELGFTRDGLATAPDINALETSGSDQERWVGLSRKEKEEEIKKLATKLCKEVEVTQALRQEGYDNYQTTDDHGMLIYGTAKDQTGKKFYLVKNSWGTENRYKGTWYASEAFVAYKTISIVLHRDALPKTLRSKLGI
ncbi:MAG: C1 family peptidase [Tannerella sp.]|jgi:aminopeptidase C|nr:C1 family peptidase [Tannerella sp.]